MYIYFLIKVKQIEIIFSRLNKQSEEIKGIKDEKKKNYSTEGIDDFTWNSISNSFRGTITLHYRVWTLINCQHFYAGDSKNLPTRIPRREEIH